MQMETAPRYPTRQPAATYARQPDRFEGCPLWLGALVEHRSCCAAAGVKVGVIKMAERL